jgi:hypothetical protein
VGGFASLRFVNSETEPSPGNAFQWSGTIQIVQAGERRGLRESYKESFRTATKYQNIKTKTPKHHTTSSDTASRTGHFSSAEEIAETREVDRWVGPRAPLGAVWRKQSLPLLAIQPKLTLK